MISDTAKRWSIFFVISILAAACTPSAGPAPTADPTVTLIPTPTAGPEETEHQTVLPPAPTDTPDSTPVDQDPTIQVEPLTTAVGGEVEILGEGFPANTRVEIGIGRVNSEYDIVDAAQTDGDGHLQTTFVIPDFVQPEDRWVIVVRSAGGDIELFSGELEITG